MSRYNGGQAASADSAVSRSRPPGRPRVTEPEGEILVSGDSAVWTAARHPLARLLREVASGSYPPQDGAWVRVAPWAQHLQGIVSFCRHTVLAVSYDTNDATLADLGVNGDGGALDPRVLTTLAGPSGWIDTLDVLLVARGAGAEGLSGRTLVTRNDHESNDLVQYSRRVRQDVQVLGPADGDSQDLVVLGRGLAGLSEISFAVDERLRGQGRATQLVTDALACIPRDELVVARVAPARAPTLRAMIRAGFVPVGSVQLFSNRPERRS